MYRVNKRSDTVALQLERPLQLRPSLPAPSLHARETVLRLSIQVHGYTLHVEGS
jgi:hypothetical protein